MKNNIFRLLILSFIITIGSCNEDDRILFDPTNQEDTILNLGTPSSETSAAISLLPLETGLTLDITLQSSTTFPNDRSFSVNVIEEETTIADIYYSAPSTITIPSNEFTSTLTITAQDPVGDILSGDLVIEVTDGDFLERFTITIAIVAPFAGSYQMTVIEGVFPNFGATLTFADQEVFIGFGEDQEGQPRERFIQNLAYLPEFNGGGFPFDLQFQISEENTISVPLQSSGGGVVCMAGTPPIEMESTPDTEASVNPDDDSSYQIILFDGVGDDACNIDPYQIIIQLERL